MKRHHHTSPGYAHQSDGAKRFATAGLLSLALLLTACGGGGDTSSGGGTSTGIAGTYSGLGTGTVTGGGLSVPFSGSVTFEIDAGGNVTLDPGQSYSVTAALGGDSFDLATSASVVDSRCNGTLNVHGTLSGGVITGSMSSSGLSCLGVAGNLSATYSASKVAKALGRSRNTLMKSFSGAVDSLR